MIFMNLDRGFIRGTSEVLDSSYVYSLGKSIEVTAKTSSDVNKLLSKSLSASASSDKFLSRYCPTNTVIFDIDFINDELDTCSLCIEDGIVRIGYQEKYKVSNGVLAFSGVLSLDGKLMYDIPIYGNSKHVKSLKNRVRILSVGLKDENLYALYYIQPIKGVVIGGETEDVGISAVTLRETDCVGYNKLYVSDWFDNAIVSELSNTV